jgi:hypothetical protein
VVEIWFAITAVMLTTYTLDGFDQEKGSICSSRAPIQSAEWSSRLVVLDGNEAAPPRAAHCLWRFRQFLRPVCRFLPRSFCALVADLAGYLDEFRSHLDHPLGGQPGVFCVGSTPLPVLFGCTLGNRSAACRSTQSYFSLMLFTDFSAAAGRSDRINDSRWCSACSRFRDTAQHFSRGERYLQAR